MAVPAEPAEPARACKLRLGTHTSCFALLKPQVEGRAKRVRRPGWQLGPLRVPSLQRGVLEWASSAPQGSCLWMWSVPCRLRASCRAVHCQGLTI